jgi:hypothetical protein
MLMFATAFVLALQAPAWMMDWAPNVVHRIHQGPFDGKQPRTRSPVTLQIETDVVLLDTCGCYVASAGERDAGMADSSRRLARHGLAVGRG